MSTPLPNIVGLVAIGHTEIAPGIIEVHYPGGIRELQVQGTKRFKKLQRRMERRSPGTFARLVIAHNKETDHYILAYRAAETGR